jgi:hypothetical protein
MEVKKVLTVKLENPYFIVVSSGIATVLIVTIISMISCTVPFYDLFWGGFLVWGFLIASFVIYSFLSQKMKEIKKWRC